MRWEMLPKARRNSLKRLGPSPRVQTTSTDHLVADPGETVVGAAPRVL